MVLKFTVYIRKEAKVLVKFRYLELFGEIFNFGIYFTKNQLF